MQLVVSREAEEQINEIGILIDSIDASRKSLQIKMMEGNSYADYVARLSNINSYVQKTEAKLQALEVSSQSSSKASASSIRRLKADLEKSSQEILALQLQIVNLSNENRMVWAKVNEKDSILLMKDQVIQLRQSDIAFLENQRMETKDKNQIMVSNLYYAQAAALEMAANRTQFAPNKKKEARLEALELYKLSLSLGNRDAQARINDLEKKLS